MSKNAYNENLPGNSAQSSTNSRSVSLNILLGEYVSSVPRVHLTFNSRTETIMYNLTQITNSVQC
jgi:hypothetical protein